MRNANHLSVSDSVLDASTSSLHTTLGKYKRCVILSKELEINIKIILQVQDKDIKAEVILFP